MADDGRIAKLLRSCRHSDAPRPVTLWSRGSRSSLHATAVRAPPSPHLSPPPTSATTSLADMSQHPLPIVPPSLLESEGIHASLPPPPDRCHHHNRCSGALSPPAPLQLSHPAIITSTPPTTTHTHITLRRLGAAPHPARCSRRHRCGRGRGHAALTPPKASDQIRGALALCARGVPFIETRRSLERAGAPERRDGATFL